MSISAAAIDRIVANVLDELRTSRGAAQADRPMAVDPGPSPSGTAVSISGNVITADSIADVPNNSSVLVSAKAIVTPAAWDVSRERHITIERGETASASQNKSSGKTEAESGSQPALLLVVRNTDAVDRLWEDLQSGWKRELLGCPDDAAALAMSAVCRGEADKVVILVEQVHRAACLANRNESIKAAAVNNSGDVRAVRKQLKANVWCLDPTGRTYFELRNMMKAI